MSTSDCDLRDQVALVTGGGRGLGRAFAIALAQKGMRVAVASRGVEGLSITVELLRAKGIEALAIPTDVTDEVCRPEHGFEDGKPARTD